MEHPLHKTQQRLRFRQQTQTVMKATELRDKPQDFERFNVGSSNEFEKDAHICLPGVDIWEQRKEEYHKEYLDKRGKEQGIELDLEKLNLERLSSIQRKRVIDAHHQKFELAWERNMAAQNDILLRLLLEASKFRRYPAIEKWEKIGCCIAADEYLLFKLPGALLGGKLPFWGVYYICHADADHMEGNHVLMTGMENRIENVKYSQLCFNIVKFRVDLELAEEMLARVDKIEAELRIPLDQAEGLKGATKIANLMTELQEHLECCAAGGDLESTVEKANADVVHRLMIAAGAMVTELADKYRQYKKSKESKAGGYTKPIQPSAPATPAQT